MNGEQFDSSTKWRPFRTADATTFGAQAGRCTTLASALWGKTSEDLQRQLLAPHPEIPAGFALDDFLNLQRWVEKLSLYSSGPGLKWWPGLRSSATGWKARAEIIRRAIEYLENR